MELQALQRRRIRGLQLAGHKWLVVPVAMILWLLLDTIYAAGSFLSPKQSSTLSMATSWSMLSVTVEANERQAECVNDCHSDHEHVIALLCEVSNMQVSEVGGWSVAGCSLLVNRKV